MSRDFANFTKQWNIKHTTTSPFYAKANGQAESANREKYHEKDPHGTGGCLVGNPPIQKHTVTGRQAKPRAETDGLCHEEMRAQL